MNRILASTLLTVSLPLLFAHAAPEPVIINAGLVDGHLNVQWSQATNSFILVRYDDLNRPPAETVASADGSAAVTSAQAPLSDRSALFAVRFGIRAVAFNDANLEAAVRNMLAERQGPSNRVYDTELAGLESFQSQGAAITDLSGLEYLKNASRLVLRSSGFHDLSPLVALTGLRELEIGGNQISSLASGLEWSQLQALGAAHNNLDSLTGLEGLTTLQSLDAGNNRISGLTPLTGLTALTELYLDHNEIEDITALTGLTHLRVLDLSNNRITDLAPLLNNPGLGAGAIIYLSGNSGLDLDQVVALRARGATVIFP